MKIVFLLVGTEGRPTILNGDTIRFGGAACSGTDQSVIMVSEYLAENGHDVTIVLDKTDGQTCRNVKYTNFNYEGLVGQDVDILVSCLWFDGYNKIPFNVNKGLVYWFHMAWVYSINEMVDYCNTHNVKLSFVNISKWAENQNQWSVDIGYNKVKEVSHKIIPNPIMTDLMDEVLEMGIERKPKSSIFHAQYGRGGDVANRVINELGWEDMYKFDYVNPSNGVDKISLFSKLVESDYFIFPLYHPNGCVYKDTFSCSVAEAISAGVIVITYPLGAVPEYFSDGCQFLQFPHETDMEKMLSEKVTCNAQYLNITSNVKDKILEIESTPGLKEEIRNKTKNTIKNRFSISIVGEMWVELVNELNNE
jgi:glycosyltransferase involved in cell wall biosynthesis